MNVSKKNVPIILVTLFLVFFSCRDLTETNVNPNGIPEENANPTFIVTNVLTEAANQYLDLSYGHGAEIRGAMQHVQNSAHFRGVNNYDWSDQSWSEWYSLLMDNKKTYEIAEKNDRKFVMGVSLVMKSFMFGVITDLWGPAPYSAALNGDGLKNENAFPEYDSQETIYKGIIEDLKKANALLEESDPIIREQDVYYNGDKLKWQKFANSLRLRYYMRVSSKLPDFAREGIENVVSSNIYFKSNDDDATMGFEGDDKNTSWPDALEFETHDGDEFRRQQMAKTLVDTLREYDDPRLSVWARKVETPIKIDDKKSSVPDKVINGVRYIHHDAIPSGLHPDEPDTNDYVGIPTSISSPDAYNLNPTPGDAARNPHVSLLNKRYEETTGPLLRARIISYAEVNFILAEAALKGWGVNGSAKNYYEEAIRASLDTWEVGDNYRDYITNSHVEYNGTLKQLVKQKWIASWTNEVESWNDYRRTGYPELQTGPDAKRRKLPVRFVYSSEELNQNTKNVEQALDKLEETDFSGGEGKNSPWSKPWLIQDTDEPW